MTDAKREFLLKNYGEKILEMPIEQREHHKRTWNALRKTKYQTRMLAEQNGRELTKHKNICCDICFDYIGNGVRYNCLDCKSFDLCEICEVNLKKKKSIFIIIGHRIS